MILRLLRRVRATHVIMWLASDVTRGVLCMSACSACLLGACELVRACASATATACLSGMLRASCCRLTASFRPLACVAGVTCVVAGGYVVALVEPAVQRAVDKACFRLLDVGDVVQWCEVHDPPRHRHYRDDLVLGTVVVVVDGRFVVTAVSDGRLVALDSYGVLAYFAPAPSLRGVVWTGSGPMSSRVQLTLTLTPHPLRGLHRHLRRLAEEEDGKMPSLVRMRYGMAFDRGPWEYGLTAGWDLAIPASVTSERDEAGADARDLVRALTFSMHVRARVIQRAWRRAISDPSFAICRLRLVREFSEWTAPSPC